MKYENRNTNDLIPYANNANTHSDDQITRIASSIKEFGFINPIIIDADNGIIAGHGRVMAAQKLGLDKVPVLRVEHLSDTQKKAYILADNRLAETGTNWDENLLRVEFEELEKLGFDAELTGFDSEYLSKMFDDAVSLEISEEQEYRPEDRKKQAKEKADERAQSLPEKGGIVSGYTNKAVFFDDNLDDIILELERLRDQGIENPLTALLSNVVKM